MSNEQENNDSSLSPDEMPVLRLEIKNMQYAIQRVLDETHSRLTQRLEKLADQYDFDAEVERQFKRVAESYVLREINEFVSTVTFPGNTRMALREYYDSHRQEIMEFLENRTVPSGSEEEVAGG